MWTVKYIIQGKVMWWAVILLANLDELHEVRDGVQIFPSGPELL